MIIDATKLALPARIRADVCVVGSGPGGASVATAAAEAGLSVVVLERGGLVTPGSSTQREEQMVPRLLYRSGTQTTADRAVQLHQGQGVGGSSLHNINLVKRVPDVILRRWIEERGLTHLPLERWHALYQHVEQLLAVSEIPAELRSRHNRILEDGCRALSWRGGPLSHNRTGCVGSGYCILGCAYDAKNNALKVLVPRLVAAGGQVLTHVHATRVVHDGERASGVEGVVVDPASGEERGALVVEARAVCASASATSTAALLLRSSVPDPSATTGNGLRIHPALLAAGEFPDVVDGWRGIPQSYECTEHLDLEGERGGRRAWIVPAFGHPMTFATMLPGHGKEQRALLERYRYLAPLTAMIHDDTRGTVRPSGARGQRIDYWPHDDDRRELMFGVAACARLLFAAGARRVYLPTRPWPTEVRAGDVDKIASWPLEKGALDVAAVHPMATVPMGDDPRTAAVDSRGRHHHLEGLWVADGSLFPTSVGVPPQLSIYALGRHVGEHLVGELGA